MNPAVSIPSTPEPALGSRKLVWQALVRIGACLLVLAAFFFLPAGTLNWWQAWVYIGVLFAPMSLFIRYLIRHDPALMERRMRLREREKEQRNILKYSYPIFFLAFLLPGFDRRFGWSSVPMELVLLSDLLVLAGYLFVIRVLMENSYASRVIEVEKEQKLIDTGLYARVRHPMYAGVIVMYLFSPLALGSWPAAVVMLAFPVIIVLRIRNEEEVLSRDLAGYREYMEKVKFRLLPGVW